MLSFFFCCNLKNNSEYQVPSYQIEHKIVETRKRGMIMYLLFGIFLAVCIVFLCIQFFRKRSIIRKIKRMDACQKVSRLNELLDPFGFCYQEKHDVIMTTVDAWQRQFGYRSLFDRTAVRFGMVFDCEPVFFYYRGRTYRIELWKGQYGINLGAEAGIYYADSILKPEQFDNALFKSVPDDELQMIEMSLYHKGQRVFEGSHLHWWLGGFCMGKYSEPEELMLWVSISFSDPKMLSCFVDSLLHTGYRKCDITVCDMTVGFAFSCPHTKQPRLVHRWRAAWSQWKNRLFCKLFLWITKPFSCTLDRILYLYYYLPAVFRRMFKRRRNRKQKYRRRKCCKKKAV